MTYAEAHALQAQAEAFYADVQAALSTLVEAHKRSAQPDLDSLYVRVACMRIEALATVQLVSEATAKARAGA